MIEISFTVGKSEYLIAGAELTSRSRTKVAIIAGWAALAILWISGLLLLDVEEIAFGTAAITLAILLPLARWVVLQRNLRQIYEGAPFMHSEINARIDDAGTTMTYETGSSVTTWDGYQACFETKGMFVLQLSTTFIRVFPKRAFSSEQLIEFGQLLRSHRLSPGK